jgi:hypothetical protein
MSTLKTCTALEGSSPCGKLALAKGLCPAHYQRERRGVTGKRPVRHRRKDGARLVKLQPVRVDPELALLIQKEAAAWGLTIYRRIVELLEKDEPARRARVGMEPRRRASRTG